MEVPLDELTAIFERWANGKVSREEVLQFAFSICREQPEQTKNVYDCVQQHAHSDLHSIVEEIAGLLINTHTEGQAISKAT